MDGEPQSVQADKMSFLTVLFEQIESQIQFGDTKASLLIAGDAILLGVAGGMVKVIADCPNEFDIRCMAFSPAVVTALGACVLLVIALALALLAVRPARIHQKPPEELLLFSHFARLTREEFIRTYQAATPEDVAAAALVSVHMKANFAVTKFRWLRLAIDTTLGGLLLMAISGIIAFASRLLS